MVNKEFLVFLLVFFALACSGMTFKYYGLSEVVYEHGKLLGPKESDDVPFSRCAPNAQTKNPCVVLFTNDFFSLKQDYEDTKMRLKECERR